MYIYQVGGICIESCILGPTHGKISTVHEISVDEVLESKLTQQRNETSGVGRVFLAL